MARTVKDHDDKDRARKYLGRCQSLVRKGVGRMGRENAVRNFRGAGVPRGQAVMSQVILYFAGVSLHHLDGCSACVATADHCIRDLERAYRERQWQSQVYAMLAVQFQGLDTKTKRDMNGLIRKGAKRAIGFYSLALDHGLRSTDPSCSTYSGIDIAIVKLIWTLPGLSSIQPHVLTEREVAYVRAYFRAHPGAKVMIHVEGLGEDVCEEWDHGGEERAFAKKVKWREVSSGKLTRTKGSGMRGGEFGEMLSKASHTNCVASQIALKDAGALDIDEIYVPPAFSGGGAYTSLPAKALRPAASANAPAGWTIKSSTRRPTSSSQAQRHNARDAAPAVSPRAESRPVETSKFGYSVQCGMLAGRCHSQGSGDTQVQ